MGNPTNVGIAQAQRFARDLDRAATNAVRKWKFEPAMKDGKAVASDGAGAGGVHAATKRASDLAASRFMGRV